jgi:VanZ family protein
VVAGTLPTQGLVNALAPQREGATTAAGHFIEYCVLAILVSGAVRASQGGVGRALWPVAIAAMLGASVEAIQAFLPYRDAQFSDVVVNLLGAIVGAVAFGVVSAARRSRR